MPLRVVLEGLTTASEAAIGYAARDVAAPTSYLVGCGR